MTTFIYAVILFAALVGPCLSQYGPPTKGKKHHVPVSSTLPPDVANLNYNPISTPLPDNSIGSSPVPIISTTGSGSFAWSKPGVTFTEGAVQQPSSIGGCGTGASGCTAVHPQRDPNNPFPFLNSIKPTAGEAQTISCGANGYACVPKNFCQNGFITGTGHPQTGVCNTLTHVCCRTASAGQPVGIPDQGGCGGVKGGSCGTGIFQQPGSVSGSPAGTRPTYGTGNISPSPIPSSFVNQPQNPSASFPPTSFKPRPGGSTFQAPGSNGIPIGGSIYDGSSYPVTQSPNQNPYTGPLNTTPHPGCAAALKCVPESYCDSNGVMSDQPVTLTREQAENRVPMTDCQNPDTGIIGKCCRDPNYKDPWPGGMMIKGDITECASGSACRLPEECGDQNKVRPFQNCLISGSGSSGMCCFVRGQQPGGVILPSGLKPLKKPTPSYPSTQSKPFSQQIPSVQPFPQQPVQPSPGPSSQPFPQQYPSAQPFPQKPSVKPFPQQYPSAQPFPQQPSSAQPFPQQSPSAQPFPPKPSSVKPFPQQYPSAQPFPQQPSSAQPFPQQSPSTQPFPQQPSSNQPFPQQPSSAQQFPQKPSSAKPYPQQYPTQQSPSAQPFPQQSPSAQQFPQQFPSAQPFPQQPSAAQPFPQQLPSAQPFPQQLPSAQPFPQQLPSAQTFPQQTSQPFPQKPSSAKPLPQQYPTQQSPSAQPFPQQPSIAQPLPQQLPSAQPFPQQLPSAKPFPQKPPSTQTFPQQPSGSQYFSQHSPSSPPFSQKPEHTSVGQPFPQKPAIGLTFPQQSVSSQSFPLKTTSGQNFPQQATSSQPFPQGLPQPAPSSQYFPGQSSLEYQAALPVQSPLPSPSSIPGVTQSGSYQRPPSGIQPPQSVVPQTQPGYIAPKPGAECGIKRQVNRQGLSNTDAGFAEFPWQALLIANSNQSALCSAAIVSERAVITAAHCLHNLESSDISVKAGVWKLHSEDQRKPIQEIQAAAIARHPKFDAGSLFNDLAIVLLEEPLHFDEHIDKICLPLSQPDLSRYQGCIATGWGKGALQGNVPGSILHQIAVKLIPQSICEEKLQQSYLGRYFRLNPSFQCAIPSDSAEDMCKVDAGGPVACDTGNGHYELGGVYSWDIGCTTSQSPTVFGGIDTDWIKSVLTRPIDDIAREELNEVLKQQQQQELTGVDIDSKPGFSQGYGKK